MPTYHVDLTTDRGLQRVPFTLDDDRPLGPQITHVLEELRQRGMVLRGGPEDEAIVIWNGREVDGGKPPAALGVTPMYPLEIRMRRRGVRAERRAEPPAKPFLPKQAYLGPVAGLTGAGLAWIVSAVGFTDLGALLSSYGALDVAVTMLLGGLIGAVVAATSASLRAGPVLGGLSLGALAGALGAGAGSFLGLVAAGVAQLGDGRTSFIGARLLVWAISGGFLGAGVGVLAVGHDRRRPLDGLLYGLLGGLVGGLIMTLPGPTDLWQMLGFLVLGAAVGAGLVLPGLGRAVGVIELERVGDRSVGILRHRGWEVPHDGVTAIGRVVEVRSRGGRPQLVPTGRTAESVQLGGKPVTGPTDLLNLDTVAIGDRWFRFRRFPDTGL